LFCPMFANPFYELASSPLRKTSGNGMEHNSSILELMACTEDSKVGYTKALPWRKKTA
jgi:hypothetical protein